VIATAIGHLCGAGTEARLAKPASRPVMTISLSRRGAAEPFHAMDVLAAANALAAQGKPVISLAVGQPSDPAPDDVRQAAIRAIEAGNVGYTDSLGIAPLRRAIAAHYRDHYGLDLPEQRIAVTTGSSAGFNLAFLAMFDVGDRVAIASPGYPAYRNIMHALGIETAEIEEDERGYLTAAAIGQAHRAKPLKGLLFASPANPTGAIIPADELRAILALAADLGIAVISDEIYHRLAYEAPDVSALSVEPEVTVINSFSKYYCMTGWRVGWMVLPERLMRQVERIAQNLYISAPAVSQVAAVEAFGATEALERIKDRYRENRALLMRRLPQLGFRIAAPMDGAFYAYCDVSQHTNDSMEFARRMLAEALVAATPGLDFDTRSGHRFLRMSYAGSPTEIAEALDRIERWLG
jgi:aspartate/methionine/tyrosine aminotransferase